MECVCPLALSDVWQALLHATIQCTREEKRQGTGALHDAGAFPGAAYHWSAGLRAWRSSLSKKATGAEAGAPINLMNPPPTTLFTGKFLALIKEGRWEYVDRIGATGAAVIVAVTNEKKILLVEQYRIPVHARTIELPAGIVGDEPGNSAEEMADAAKRELLEETGYSAERIEILTRGPASSGLTSEVVTLCLATGLKRVNAGGGVGHEEIIVHEVPLSVAHEWLAAKMKAGLLVEPKVYAGLYFLAE